LGIASTSTRAYTCSPPAEHSGFDLEANGPIPTAPAPSEEELHVLRQVIRRKMLTTGTYAAWAQRFLGNETARSV